MAAPVEEEFIFNELRKMKSGNVLEFGCGTHYFPGRIAALGHKVTAVDLYQRSAEANFKFIQGDFEHIELQDSYDCIYGLSSFEHIGLEQDGILPEDQILSKIDRILQKMRTLLRTNGYFIITLPFGNFGYYYVNKDGKWSYKREKDSIWGAKVYDLKDIDEIFKQFLLIKSEFYLRTGKDYFNKESWTKVECKNCYKAKEETDAVVCLEFINQIIYS